MLQKSYYHVWIRHEILHWMNHKNKNLKKNRSNACVRCETSSQSKINLLYKNHVRFSIMLKTQRMSNLLHLDLMHLDLQYIHISDSWGWYRSYSCHCRSWSNQWWSYLWKSFGFYHSSRIKWCYCWSRNSLW